MALTPKTPETEAGIEARQQYLALAREIIGDPAMDYTMLYQRFAENDWAAIKLDDEVAQRALKGGQAPKNRSGDSVPESVHAASGASQPGADSADASVCPLHSVDGDAEDRYWHERSGERAIQAATG